MRKEKREEIGKLALLVSNSQKKEELN